MSESAAIVPSVASVRAPAVVAGVGLLLMALLSPFALLYVFPMVVVPGDAALTVSNIGASGMLFRAAILCIFAVVVLDVVVALALHAFFKPASRGLSLLVATFRILYAGMFAVALGNAYHALQLVDGSSYGSGLGPDALDAQVMALLGAFQHGWDFALLMFGAHLLALGYVALRSGYVPNIVGGLVAVAGAGYLVDGLGRLMLPHAGIALSSFTFVGEVVFLFWLLARGGRARRGGAPLATGA